MNLIVAIALAVTLTSLGQIAFVILLPYKRDWHRFMRFVLAVVLSVSSVAGFTFTFAVLSGADTTRVLAAIYVYAQAIALWLLTIYLAFYFLRGGR